ncbi:MAG TPA: hypothetical protein V6D14_01500 [Coleofasciculaceae cyanobacterium]|jgi:hypothetical protein
MRIKPTKLISLLSGTLALVIVVYSVFHSGITIAASFADNLPPGYTVYPGQLAIGKACTCATGGISGAPAPPPPCNVEPCFGSSNTRYAWVTTSTPGIDSKFCNELRKSRSQSAIPPCFQLDGDDALVLSGSMAPAQNLTYYSFNLYQSFTYSNKFPSNYAGIQTSVNIGLNNSNLRIGNNGQYVLIVTASTSTLNTIKNALKTAGVPDQIVSSYLVPASVANLGTLYYPDQLSFLLRLTAQSDAERQQLNTFLQQNARATKIAFVKGPGIKGDITFNDIPKWENRLGVNKLEYSLGLDKKLTALEQVVTNSYAKQGYKLKARLPEKLVHADPNSCRATPETCAYDSPDALYISYPCDFSPTALRTGNCYYQLPGNSDDVLMLLGVNHPLVSTKPLATYFSEESKAIPGSKDGTFSFVGLYTKGSANQYLQPSNGANLYAVKIARDCGTQPYCAAVPYLGGIPEKTGFYILGRIYLDKNIKTAPNPENLVPSVLLWFTKG